MNFRKLPRYRGLPDRKTLRSEFDGHGKKPSLRLRDFAMMFVIVPLVVLLWFCANFHFKMQQRRIGMINEISVHGSKSDSNPTRTTP